jgi:ABC-type uncharacterized transport system permease subunit
MLIWYLAGGVAAVAVGWLAAIFHGTGHAPVGLVSLGVGAALGAALAVLAARLHVTCRTRLVVGTILLSLVTIIAEHAWLYRDFRRQWHRARNESAQVALFRPESPWSPAEYFARELATRRAALWGADAVLIAGAAAGSVLLGLRVAGRNEGVRVGSERG